MNILSIEKKSQILQLLAEGNSMRSVERIVGCSINTVTKTLEQAGAACQAYQDRVICNVKAKRVQCDEIWGFCYSKQKHATPEQEGVLGYGEVWTRVALDADSKLAISWLVGLRTAEYADAFMADLASRLEDGIQLTTDDHGAYVKPVEKALRKFTRLTTAFSKKIENLEHAVALHFMYYNFVRIHKTLRVTPAMKAGITNRLWSIEDVARLIPEPVAKKRGSYKKKN